jgi:hypothetical protein
VRREGAAPADQVSVIPGRGKAANPESSRTIGGLGWIPGPRADARVPV